MLAAYRETIGRNGRIYFGDPTKFQRPDAFEKALVKYGKYSQVAVVSYEFNFCRVSSRKILLLKLYIFDVTETYTLAIIIVMLALCVMCTAIWVAAPRKVRRVAFPAKKTPLT